MDNIELIIFLSYSLVTWKIAYFIKLLRAAINQYESDAADKILLYSTFFPSGWKIVGSALFNRSHGYTLFFLSSYDILQQEAGISSRGMKRVELLTLLQRYSIFTTPDKHRYQCSLTHVCMY